MNRSLAVCATVAIIIAWSFQAAAVSISIGTQFTGRTRNEAVPSNEWGLPPDTMGAVGSDHIVEMLNDGYAVYDKSNGQLIESDSLAGFWQNAGTEPKVRAYDPKLLYDPDSERWFAVTLDSSDLMVAVSDSSDPTQGWSGFTLDIDPTDQTTRDFPQLGIDAEGVYVTVADRDPNQQVSTTIAVLPKADLLAPTPTVANATLITKGRFDVGFNPHPAVDLDGSTGPVPMIDSNVAVAGVLAASRIGGTIDAPAIQDQQSISVPTVIRTGKLPQPGPKADFGSGGPSTVGPGMVLQRGVLWAVQKELIDDRGAIRWYKIDPDTFDILEMGNITDEDLHLAFPSVAVNDRGQVVIGFGGSSESQFMSAYAVVGETIGDSTVFGDLLLLQEGVSDYEVLDIWGNNRWGDYSSTVLDPDDPSSFWTFQLYVDDTDVWGVSISQILVPEPGTGLLVGLGLVGLGARRQTR